MTMTMTTSICFLQDLRSGGGQTHRQWDSPEQRKGRWTLDEDKKVETAANQSLGALFEVAHDVTSCAARHSGFEERHQELVAHCHQSAGSQREAVSRALVQAPGPGGEQEPLDTWGGPHYLPRSEAAGEPLGHHLQAAAWQVSCLCSPLSANANASNHVCQERTKQDQGRVEVIVWDKTQALYIKEKTKTKQD